MGFGGIAAVDNSPLAALRMLPDYLRAEAEFRAKKKMLAEQSAAMRFNQQMRLREADAADRVFNAELAGGKYDTNADRDLKRQTNDIYSRQVDAQIAGSRASQLYQRDKLSFDQKKWNAKQATGGGGILSGTGLDQQLINMAYQDNLRKGLDPDTAAKTAVNTVLGRRVRSYTDDKGNRVTEEGKGIFDEIPAQPPVVTSSAAEEPPPLPAEYKGMTALEAAEAGTGPVSSAVSAWNSVAGNVGLDDPRVTTARRELNSLNERLADGLRVGERFSVTEQQHIMKSIGISPDVTSNPAVLKDEIRQSITALDYQTAVLDSTSRNPNLDKATRNDAAAKANVLRSLRPLLERPTSTAGGAPQGASMKDKYGLE